MILGSLKGEIFFHRFSDGKQISVFKPRQGFIDAIISIPEKSLLTVIYLSGEVILYELN